MTEPDKHIPALLFAMVMDIINDMPLDVRVTIANLEEDDIWVMELTLGKYLLSRLKQFDDDRLMQLSDDCLSITDDQAEKINEIQTVLRTVWQVLKKTHRLRAVK